MFLFLQNSVMRKITVLMFGSMLLFSLTHTVMSKKKCPIKHMAVVYLVAFRSSTRRLSPLLV